MTYPTLLALALVYSDAVQLFALVLTLFIWGGSMPFVMWYGFKFLKK